MTAYAETMTVLRDHRRRIEATRKEMRRIQREVTPETVADYSFAGPAGPVRLSELFGDKHDLFVIHNMGRGCSHCTMWADGFNGVYHHLANRAAFALTSPDPVDVQQSFAASRGWRFPMVSHAGTTFADDMGYVRDGKCWPGVSAFRRVEGRIERVSDAELGPGDDFCAVWHLFDLMPNGPDGWEPKFRYPAAETAAA
jgi:predicted dithiol-disulfide oxidoreductase (DUF899 family)